ncbi:hypothetical protein C1A38_05355 [Verrucosispora sp. ts21]|uniref:hypothetical protein n=1 Tax=Verrucosispora sp. ts21 TaxID=2069341 RepID=UPI000C889103|nr:hypothetical protein [Verrucosispora sp. ts21]PMR62208.1 hypothetical protein C1A38_05355 [Verrucosispora sp. ts21]
MERFDEGLRCQDVHSGLRNLDPNSGSLTQLADTQLIGMAASLAALVRGQDVISDAQALRALAAEQLDVNQFAFDQVIALLDEVEFVAGVQRAGGKITKFTENVPYYDDLYTMLGEAWRDRSPTEVEQQMIVLVHHLADAPVPIDGLADRLGLDTSVVPNLLEVGERAELVKKVSLLDGDVIYSPFFGFENPELISDLVREHGSEQLALAFAALRNEQGMPVTEAQPVLQDAIARGLLLAPAVELRSGLSQPFATLPYVLDPQLLRARKPVLEKALAMLACLRCGQYYGEYNSLTKEAMVAIIDKLLDPGRGFLVPHQAHRRQYRLMHAAGLLAFDADLRPGGSWVTPRFIDTPDNREALTIARDLITHGEPLAGRVGEDQARAALVVNGRFTAPMQTLSRLRGKAAIPDQKWQSVIDKAFGKGQLR